MKDKLKCSFIRAWNCRRIAIAYFNGQLICKKCLSYQIAAAKKGYYFRSLEK